MMVFGFSGFRGFRVRVRPSDDMCVLVFLDLSMQIKKVDMGPWGWRDWAVAGGCVELWKVNCGEFAIILKRMVEYR